MQFAVLTVLLWAGLCLFGTVSCQLPATPLFLTHTHPHYHRLPDGRYFVHSHIHTHPLTPTVTPATTPAPDHGPGTAPPIPTTALNLLQLRMSLRVCTGGKFICPFNPLQLQFLLNVTCVDPDRLCNGVNDCPDGFDETVCKTTAAPTTPTTTPTATTAATTTTTVATTTPPPPCKEGFYVCADKKCAKLCDGNKECTDGADEMNCPCTGGGEIRCTLTSTKAMGCAKLCDAKQECEGNEDEINCGCANSTEIRCVIANTSKPGCAKLCDKTVACVGSIDELPTNCGTACKSTEMWCKLATGAYGCATKCNQKSECAGGEDEVLSACSCASDQKACALKAGGVGCAKMCDKTTECTDQTDEDLTICRCPEGKMYCKSKADATKYICTDPCIVTPTGTVPTTLNKCNDKKDIQCGCTAGQALCAKPACAADGTACAP